LRAAATFRGEAKVTTWLHRIVVNACLDRARRSKVRPTSPMPSEDRLPAAEDDIGRTERAAEVQRALAGLPVEQAAALVLVDALGYPVELAAEILEAPTGTVKSRCARGRARLAVALGHLRDDGNRSDPDSVTGMSPGNTATTESTDTADGTRREAGQ
jgi:RNA polymerase sigma-70 factor, ECF subfamily